MCLIIYSQSLIIQEKSLSHTAGTCETIAGSYSVWYEKPSSFLYTIVQEHTKLGLF